MKKFTMTGSFLGLALALLIGSTGHTYGGSSTVGTGNPASYACVAAKGEDVSITDQNGGQFDLCRIGGGLISDWTLFQATRQGTKTEAVTDFENGQVTPKSGPQDTWAAQNCRQLGGQISEVTETLRPTTKYQLCRLPDQSVIEAWTLFSGPGTYQELGKVLNPSAVNRSE